MRVLSWLDPQAHAQRNARTSLQAMRLRRGQTEEAEQAVDAVLASSPDAPTAMALRAALKSLGRQR